MKTTKLMLTFLMMMAILSLSATRATEPVKEEANEVSKVCTVTLAQMETYLETGSHHHTVYWIQYIAGTCNGLAGIGGCSTATVYVQDGIIVGHMDNQINCD